MLTHSSPAGWQGRGPPLRDRRFPVLPPIVLKIGVSQQCLIPDLDLQLGPSDGSLFSTLLLSWLLLYQEQGLASKVHEEEFC